MVHPLYWGTQMGRGHRCGMHVFTMNPIMHDLGSYIRPGHSVSPLPHNRRQGHLLLAQKLVRSTDKLSRQCWSFSCEHYLSDVP